MAKYLLQVNYTVSGIQGVVAEGGSARLAAAKGAIESAGGTLESFYFAFGVTDVFVIADFPDSVSAAAVALTVSAGGGAAVNTTVLLTPEEVDAATKKTVGYRPPGG